MKQRMMAGIALAGTAVLLVGLLACNYSYISSFVQQSFNQLLGGKPAQNQQQAIKQTGSLTINIFDGTRQLVPQGTRVLVRILDGNQKFVVDHYYSGPSIRFDGLPFYDNFGDNYTVIVWTPGYEQAGFTPVKIKPGTVPVVDLMLLPSKHAFDFSEASFNVLKLSHPQLWLLINSGVTQAQAKARYEKLLRNDPLVLACLLNIAIALQDTLLPNGNPILPYLRELTWDSLRKDRFFGYGDAKLIAELQLAVQRGTFDPESGAFVFHPGATASFKQRQYGEANLHLTFYEKETSIIDGVECVRVEVDIDYYRDGAAHTILEILPHLITGGASDPRTVYQLRWIAARHAGSNFNPPYKIVPKGKTANQR